MLGIKELAEAARREIGDGLLKNPLRISCPRCGTFLLKVLAAPTMVNVHCQRCRQNFVALVSKECEIMITTEKQ